MASPDSPAVGGGLDYLPAAPLATPLLAAPSDPGSTEGADGGAAGGSFTLVGSDTVSGTSRSGQPVQFSGQPVGAAGAVLGAVDGAGCVTPATPVLNTPASGASGGRRFVRVVGESRKSWGSSLPGTPRVVFSVSPARAASNPDGRLFSGTPARPIGAGTGVGGFQLSGVVGGVLGRANVGTGAISGQVQRGVVGGGGGGAEKSSPVRSPGFRARFWGRVKSEFHSSGKRKSI